MQTIASSWATFIRTHHLEDRVLQATSAGNQHALLAAGNSGWSAAALRSDLTTPEGRSQPPLSDILVVENTSDSGAPAYQPGCLSPSSNIGGTIAAPGVGVYSNLIGADAGPESGTSMSSPEVAGLAEYLWSINPDLTAPEIVRLIGQTAQPPRVACQDAPVLDAYAATLGLDEPGCFIATCAPSRLATLDVAAPHGRFDQADVQELADHIFKTPAPTDRDWSRYDLNGDGFTGGESAAPFDLDTTGSVRGGRPILTTVTQAIHDTSGNPIEVQFDETKATDADILCYYAYSNLYTPATQNDQRDKILGDHCTPPVRVVQCGTEADSTTFAQIGSTQQTFPKDGSASHPQCTPQLNSVLPDNKSEVKTQSGCGSAAASPCDALARANGTMTAAGVVSLHGGTIRFSAKGDISGSETGGNSSADVQADSSIQFRLSTACTFTASGTIITSSGGGGAVASPAVRLTGPSGTLLNVTTGTNNANGMLQPGFYSFGGTANPNGNADSSNATFDAHADLSGTVNIAC
jgi:hypothetical protein